MKEVEVTFSSNGLFVPKKPLIERPRALISEVPKPDHLTKREQGIFDRLGVDPPSRFTHFLARSTEIIMREELGAWKPDPHTEKVRRFFGRWMVEIDDVYDNNRAAFPSHDRTQFLTSLRAIEISTMGEPHFLAGEGFAIVDKLISSSLYTPEAQTFLKNDWEIALGDGWKELLIDPSTSDAREVQMAKEVSNGLFIMMLFDLMHANLLEEPSFDKARERFIALLLGYQYRDDFRDVAEDIANNSANPLAAYARKFGEYNALQSGVQDLKPPVTNEYGEQDRYFETLQELAPWSYGFVANRQRELLNAAAIPQLTAVIAVPR